MNAELFFITSSAVQCIFYLRHSGEAARSQLGEIRISLPKIQLINTAKHTNFQLEMYIINRIFMLFRE